MKSLLKKTGLFTVILALLFGLFPMFHVEAHSDRPHPDKPKDVTNTTVSLPFRYMKLNDEKSIVKVKIENMETGEVMFQNFTLELNGDGRGVVMVTGLMPDTEYDFKMKIRKHTLEDFTPYGPLTSALTLK